MTPPMLRLILPCLVALALGACQTTDLAGGDPALDEGVQNEYILSNEPRRLGEIHFARANYALAERYFRDAVEKSSGDVESWIGLAASYDQLKRFELADRAYAQALKLPGPSVRILNNQGYSYMLRGNFGQAERYFKKALAIEPENQVILNNLELLAGARANAAGVRGA